MQRRHFLGAMGAAAASGITTRWQAGTQVESWRAYFPALRQTINGRPLAYLDSAATTLRPSPVLDAMRRHDEGDNANPGAALHTLARRSATAYESARAAVAEFIHAADPSEIVFTRGTTDGINLVAAAWGGVQLQAGDEILIGRSEHVSNMLPWQLIARKTGARVRYFGIDDQGHPLLDDFSAKAGPASGGA